jgi:hypothetical protein
MPISKTLEDYISEKIVTEDGCWNLVANVNHAGYTKVSIKGKQSLLHRLIMGEVPSGLDVDHVCHNEAAAKGECKGGTTCKHRRCFNPEHLRLATRSENLASGSKAFWNQDACPSGHLRTKENMFIDTYNRPVCKPCHRYQSMLAKRLWRKRKKDLANGR